MRKLNKFYIGLFFTLAAGIALASCNNSDEDYVTANQEQANTTAHQLKDNDSSKNISKKKALFVGFEDGKPKGLFVEKVGGSPKR